MSQLNFAVFYPHPPERVWRAITDRRALAAWLMDNDFEPRLGHKFQFFAQSLPGLQPKINCQVIELDQPKRLVYTWQDALMSQPSLVIWTLNPIDGGTQLKLEHRVVQVPQPSQPMRLPQTLDSRFMATLETQFLPPTEQKRLQLGHTDTNSFDAGMLDFCLDGGWHTALNESLQNWLTVASSAVQSS